MAIREWRGARCSALPLPLPLPLAVINLILTS